MEKNKIALEEKIVSFLGIIANVITMRSIFPIEILGIYMISKYYHYYIDHNEKPISVYYSYFIVSVFSIFHAIGTPSSGFIEHKIGLKLTVLISGLLGFLTALGCYFITNFYFSFFSFGIFGFSAGLSFLVTLKQACSYFPEKKGLIVSLFYSLGDLVNSGFIYLGEYIINPNNEKMNSASGAYSKSISENYNQYLLIIIILVPCGNLIFFFLTFFSHFKNKATPHDEVSEKKTKPINSVNIEEAAELGTPTNQEKEKNAKPPNKRKYWKDLKKVITSWTLWRMLVLAFFQTFLILMLTSTFRPVGDMMGISRVAMNLTATLSGIFVIIFSPVWGFFYDKFGFRPLATVLSICSGLNGGLFLFSLFLKSDILFPISVCINVVVLAGANSFYVPHIMNIYGMYYSMEVTGCLSIFTALISILCSTFEFLVVILYKTKSNTPFYICYGIGIAFALISLIIIYFEKEDKFQFDEDEEETIKEIEPLNEL